MSDVVIPVGLPVVRDRGCFNCVHWRGPGTDELRKRLDEVFGPFYLQCREQGMDHERSGRAVMNGLTHLSRKEAGVCLKPGDPNIGVIARLIEAEPPTFTAALAICERWTGRTQVHAPLDKLPDELRDILGLPQPKPPAPVMINADPPEEVEIVVETDDGPEAV